MKLCNTCSTVQDNACFHKRAASIDGLAAKCKSCQKEYDKKRLNKPDRVKARKEYYSENKDKSWYKEAHQLSNSAYRSNNPVKYKAHCVVNNALRDGDLTKGVCEVCGNTEVHGHHEDYAYPLQVRWLCSFHHDEWHVLNGEGANAS